MNRITSVICSILWLALLLASGKASPKDFYDTTILDRLAK